MDIESNSDEVDIVKLIELVWKQKKTIFKFLIVFMFVGVFIAIFSADEYEASVTLVPQIDNSDKMRGLGGLAALAGINITGNTDDSGIDPKLYTRITSSISFRRELVESLIKVDGIPKKISFKDYYENYYDLGVLYYIKKYTIGLPSLLFNKRGKEKGTEKSNEFSEIDGIYRVSSSENVLYEYVNEKLLIDINDKDGIVEINFSMPEALASAQMVQATQELLQKAVTKFKTEKVKSDYKFIENCYKDAKEDFLKKQFLLANYKDRNQGIILSRTRSRLERLEAEYNLAYNLYSELSKELSSQKIKLKENTPIFIVLEPVSVPLGKSKPNRLFIIGVWLLLGLVFGVGVVLFKSFLKKIKKE